MIKLPKNVIKGLVEELTSLLDKKENSLTPEQVAEVKRNNEVYSKREKDILKKIEELNKALEEVRGLIVPDPSEETVDETRIQEITDMLVLSGYYVKVVKVDGEYLEETGLYEEEPEEQEVIINVETIKEVTEEEVKADPADGLTPSEDENKLKEE